MKKLVQILLFALLAPLAIGQSQNVQTASGTTGDITKPTVGLGLPSGFTLTAKSGSALTLNSGSTLTGNGASNFGSGTSFILPNSAAPTTSAFGWIAGDNNAWASGRGALQVYDGTANTYVLAALASAVPTNGQIPRFNTGGTIDWYTPTSATTANPTGTIGLTAVNGVASTVMASDSAPPLSQAIAPTWTGVHTFTPGARSSGAAAYLAINAPADTLQTTGTNAIGVKFVASTRQHAGNTGFNDQDEWDIAAPTYTGQTATATIVNGSTFTIEGAPTASTNIAITNPFAMRLKAGAFGMGASGAIASLSQSSGLLTIASVGGLNFTPNGVMSEAGTAADFVLSGSTSFRAWQGVVATGRLTAIQAVGEAARSMVLTVNGGDSAIEGATAGGTFGALTATPTATRTRFIYRTYGGTTWAAAANIFMTTTQAQTETARGTQIALIVTPNGTTSAVNTATLDQDGSFKLNTPGGGLGYATGAGGAVTQATSKSTGVTLNKVSGQVTMNNAALAALTAVSFTLTNSAIASTDVVIVNIGSGGTVGDYLITVNSVGSGSCQITVYNCTAATPLSEALVLNFAVIKAVNS